MLNEGSFILMLLAHYVIIHAYCDTKSRNLTSSIPDKGSLFPYYFSSVNQSVFLLTLAIHAKQ